MLLLLQNGGRLSTELQKGGGRQKEKSAAVKGTIIISIINLEINAPRRIIGLLTHTHRYHSPFQHVSVIRINYMEYQPTR